jgi:ankyrin repeat protein
LLEKINVILVTGN